MTTPRFTSLGRGLYQEAGGAYYHRPHVDGRRTWRKLASITKTAALQEIAVIRSDHHRSQLGLCLDPLTKIEPAMLIVDLVKRYLAAGCPDRHLRARFGHPLEVITTALDRITQHLGREQVDDLKVSDCDRYHTLRTAQVTQGSRRGPGHRSVELELTALSNTLHWAARAGLIETNPLATGRPSYRIAREIASCNSAMPDTDEELHLLATRLLDNPKSRTLGFQVLLEALTGCRSGEVCRLRWDATREGTTAAPGYMDATSLWIHRSKHGCFPYVLLDIEPGLSPLRDLLTAMRAWHDQEHPGSPWMLPGRDERQPVKSTSLVHALARATKDLRLPRRTSHGLRAFHVRLLRSRGIDDSEIAKRLGQRSGVALVERVYGRPEPGFFGCRTLDGVPDGSPTAWSRWSPPANVVPMIQTA